MYDVCYFYMYTRKLVQLLIAASFTKLQELTVLQPYYYTYAIMTSLLLPLIDLEKIRQNKQLKFTFYYMENIP